MMVLWHVSSALAGCDNTFSINSLQIPHYQTLIDKLFCILDAESEISWTLTN